MDYDDEITRSQQRHPTTYTRPENPPLWLVLCDELLLEQEADRAEKVTRVDSFVPRVIR